MLQKVVLVKKKDMQMEVTGKRTWRCTAFSARGSIFSLVYRLVSTVEPVSNIEIWWKRAFLNICLGGSSGGSVSSLQDGFTTATVQH